MSLEIPRGPVRSASPTGSERSFGSRSDAGSDVDITLAPSTGGASTNSGLFSLDTTSSRDTGEDSVLSIRATTQAEIDQREMEDRVSALFGGELSPEEAAQEKANLLEIIRNNMNGAGVIEGVQADVMEVLNYLYEIYAEPHEGDLHKRKGGGGGHGGGGHGVSSGHGAGGRTSSGSTPSGGSSSKPPAVVVQNGGRGTWFTRPRKSDPNYSLAVFLWFGIALGGVIFAGVTFIIVCSTVAVHRPSIRHRDPAQARSLMDKIRALIRRDRGGQRDLEMGDRPVTYENVRADPNPYYGR